jgi:peptidoglycan-associated lipoprotein
MRSFRSLLIPSLGLLMVAASVAACQHRGPVVSPSLTPAAAMAPARVAALPAPPPPAPGPTPAPRRLSEDEIFARESLDELNGAQPLSDAFFDYDSATIRPDAQANLAKDATWLQRWPSTKITVSGHADERGTPEYNLALGEQRASAVKSYLQSLGVSADRIATVSYGIERPFCTQSGEACWAQNRRGHVLITAK